MTTQSAALWKQYRYSEDADYGDQTLYHLCKSIFFLIQHLVLHLTTELPLPYLKFELKIQVASLENGHFKTCNS